MLKFTLNILYSAPTCFSPPPGPSSRSSR